MNPRDALKAIAKVAPAAATVLGGPLAGTAASVIASKLGVDPTPTAIAKAVQADPELAARLASIDAELARAAMADVQHARETVGGSRWSYVIDSAVLILVAVLIYAAVFRDVPDANQNALNIILGAILGAFGTVIAYHRGSSAGSAARAAQIERQQAATRR